MFVTQSQSTDINEAVTSRPRFGPDIVEREHDF